MSTSIIKFRIISPTNYIPQVMSKNTRRGKESQEDSMRPEKCSNQTCEIYINTMKVMHGEKGISIGKTDLSHLNRFHYRTWADFGWACSAAYKNDNDKLSEENKRLHGEISKLKIVPTCDVPTADPKNHVDGFCDVLITHPSGVVFKCTEYCRYDSSKCGLHQKYPHVLMRTGTESE
jgi:hypothetical protein